MSGDLYAKNPGLPKGGRPGHPNLKTNLLSAGHPSLPKDGTPGHPNLKTNLLRAGHPSFGLEDD